MSSIERRQFLRIATGATAAVPFHSLVSRAEAMSRAASFSSLRSSGYGPLVPAIDGTTGLPLLKLPEGFRYVTFGWAGDVMSDGARTPGHHDGMGAFDAGNGRVRLVRNHEEDAGRPFGDRPYNRHGGGGGTTTLEFDTTSGRFISARASLSGTIRNCAGGQTPWGSWLSCEETVASITTSDRVSGARRATAHGYVFEVPADGVGDPTPIRDMGRFPHEALAVDRVTGSVYQTEDPGASLVDLFGGISSRAGFYRFVPHTPSRLAAGGSLFMLKVKGRDHVNLGASYAHGTTFDVEWVPIARPDASGRVSAGFVFQQGRRLGGASFARLEGCWAGSDRRVFIVSTTGGRGQGQVWVYNPVEETIALLFQSPDKELLNKPDHVTVSPRGGLVLCEDGGGDEFLHGLTPDGLIFPFAMNNVTLRGERNGLHGDFTSSEWAGPCFSPDGEWLFANIYDPGITVAITGPWGRGAI